MSGARRQGDVQVEPQPRAASPVGEGTGIHRIVAVLMQRDRQHVRVVVEDRLGPVAVVDVPVQHGDALRQPVRLHGADGDGDVGQQAKAVGEIRQGMVPRRARQGIGVVQRPLQHGAQCAGRQSRRQARGLESAGAEGGAETQFAAARVRQGLKGVDVVRRMHPQQIGACGRGGACHVQVAVQPRDGDQVLQPALRLWVLGQAAGGAGLHEAAHGHHARIVAAAMPETALVPEESRGHRAVPSGLDN